MALLHTLWSLRCGICLTAASVLQVTPGSQAMQHMQHDASAHAEQQLQPFSTAEFPAPEPFMPSSSAAMQQDMSEFGPFTSMQQPGQQGTTAQDSITDQTTWYGMWPAGDDTSASNADATQGMVQHTTVVKKAAAPGNVSRHDTPTSVFDIFNSLSIMPGSAGQSYSEQGAGGQEAALVEIPHMHDSAMLYQETEADDKWLEEFANSQVVAAQGDVQKASAGPVEGNAEGQQAIDNPAGVYALQCNVTAQ